MSRIVSSWSYDLGIWRREGGSSPFTFLQIIGRIDTDSNLLYQMEKTSYRPCRMRKKKPQTIIPASSRSPILHSLGDIGSFLKNAGIRKIRENLKGEKGERL